MIQFLQLIYTTLYTCYFNFPAETVCYPLISIYIDDPEIITDNGITISIDFDFFDFLKVLTESITSLVFH